MKGYIVLVKEFEFDFESCGVGFEGFLVGKYIIWCVFWSYFCFYVGGELDIGLEIN